MKNISKFNSKLLQKSIDVKKQSAIIGASNWGSSGGTETESTHNGSDNWVIIYNDNCEMQSRRIEWCF
jgi:hypothetical protein